jgi:hypothetical protein
MIVKMFHQDSPSPQTKTILNVLSCVDISGNRFYFSAGALPIAFLTFRGNCLGDRSERAERNAGNQLGRRTRAHGLRFGDGAVINARVTQVNFELGRPRQQALDQRFGERVLDVFLERAAN